MQKYSMETLRALLYLHFIMIVIALTAAFGAYCIDDTAGRYTAGALLIASSVISASLAAVEMRGAKR